MPSSGSFLRQLSAKDTWKSSSKRWFDSSLTGCEGKLRHMEGLNMHGDNENGGTVMRKRVMVVVDESLHSKHAMMWALTHVANKGDLLTLLHIVPPYHHESERFYSQSSSAASSCSNHLANSLGNLCKASRPEVKVEALVIQGPRFATVMSQVKKLEVTVLVLGQKKPSMLLSCVCGTSSTEEFVGRCINNAECLAIGVRKQSRGMGGYLISTRWQKNFWLLA